MEFVRDWILADRSASILENYRNTHGGLPLMVSAEKGPWLHSHRIIYDWQQLTCTWVYHHTILRLKQGFNDRRHFTMGKSLRFTIPNIKSE